ncbi:MAG: hypothetical protein FJ121_04535 [Deltaproteobacteria bacterium]|nr:hypothetical protein [Deltaproteobacteria bacterium]
MADTPNDQNTQDQPAGNAPDKGDGKDRADQNQEKTVPYARFQQVNEAKKQAETELQAVADGLKEEVPEEFRDLIPDMPPGQQIKWIRQAQAKGIFNPPKADALDSKRPGDKKVADLNAMTPHQMRVSGYKT